MEVAETLTRQNTAPIVLEDYGISESEELECQLGRKDACVKTPVEWTATVNCPNKCQVNIPTCTPCKEKEELLTQMYDALYGNGTCVKCGVKVSAPPTWRRL